MVDDRTWREWCETATDFVVKAERWFKANLWIVNRQNERVRLEANEHQRRLLFHVGLQLAAKVPVRILVLKARRRGISTIVQALSFFFGRRRQNYPTLGIAHNAKGTSTISRMCRRFYRWMPEDQQWPTTAMSREEIRYADPHGSSHVFMTAGGSEGENKAGVGRSDEYTFVHVSEMAFIHNWPTVSAGLSSCVPESRWSVIIYESTANGDQGPFRNLWHRCAKAYKRDKRHMHQILPLFFTWLGEADCSRAVPDGYDWEGFDETERRLRKLGATDEELYWRRTRIADDYDGDPELFAQEYPAWPDQSFRASGNPAIPIRTIEHHETLVELAGEPKKVLLKRDAGGKVYAEEATGLEPWYWNVLKPPVWKSTYTLFGDVAEGKMADPKALRSDLDSHAAAVLDRRELEYVATAMGRRIDADEFGEECRKCAEWYNEAWASPDATGNGLAAMPAFRGYAHTYRRQKERDHVDEGAEVGLMGFKITSGNRPFIITDWLAATRYHPDTGWDNTVKVFDPVLVDEERTFVRKPDGRCEHAPGEHDDMLWAHFGAWQLHLLCPHQTRPDEEIPEETKAALKLGPDYMFQGGTDPHARKVRRGKYDDVEVTV